MTDTGNANGPLPALLLVQHREAPTLAVLPLERGTLVVGRGSLPGVELTDTAISRRHVRVSFAGGRWLVEDQGSRNGTFVNGRELSAPHSAAQIQVIRIGATLLVPLADARPYVGGRLETRGELVVGPVSGALLAQVAEAARGGGTLHLQGESGTGKEMIARAFHAYGPARSGPFVLARCATLAPKLADRVLFGAGRGTDPPGLIMAADGGTLFLDEVAELELPVQDKLLRALESREVRPPGIARARKVEVRICSATQRDLRRMSEHGSFREALYLRLAQPELTVPALRERAEEIPALIDALLSRFTAPARLAVDARFVEECLCRPWPGNVRELCTAVRDAVHAAIDDGAQALGVDHLPLLAGVELSRSSMSMPAMPAVPAVHHAPPPQTEPGHAEIIAMLRRREGNVSGAARALGWPRNQLRRWLVREGIDPRTYGGEDDGAD